MSTNFNLENISIRAEKPLRTGLKNRVRMFEAKVY